ncbi:hypothetical protein ACFSGJ_14375 [Halodurantibacterium flavum]|uniref:Uncharacterized protein n=2 Tax=Halodurantibacterium flavum TaxID=1382802 RepID=A0ABW4S744_9RHOB
MQDKTQDKTLDRAESDLLSVILRLHAAGGRVERDALSVEARGRGLEVGRPLARLKTLGFVEEWERRPFFLRRWFGARAVALVRPTEAGLAWAPAPEPSEGAESFADDALADAAVSETAPPVPPADAPVAVPSVPDSPADLQSETPAQDVPEAVEAPEITEAPAAPVSPEAPQPTPVIPPRARAPVRPPVGYSDELGGVPVEVAIRMPVDEEVMEGLRDMLSVVGMELTMAGEALIADRIGKGASAGEALSQVVLFAFAHAIQLEHMSAGGLEAAGLRDYAVEVMREIEKLRDGGEIGDDRFEADMRSLWSLVEDAPDQAARAAALLLDPVGGAAPTAILPDDLRQADEDDTDSESY